MKKPDRYVYPAVFTYEEGQEIAVVFPDLDVATSGENDEDALFSARELVLWQDWRRTEKIFPSLRLWQR